MRIMTFNIRFDTERDGENRWLHRREVLIGLIQTYGPGLLGTQEGTPRQLQYMDDRLTGYGIHAPGRTEDPTCQYPTLFYRAGHFQVLEGGEFWLSRTPQVHRSKDWESAFPRMMHYALVRELETDSQIWAVVTHLDNLGREARFQQATMIRDWLRDREGPVILMGDFNDVPGSPVHRLLTAPETGLRDTWEVLERDENEWSMTHHDFQGGPSNGRLDWILISRHFRVREAAILRDHQGGRYPSDHFPYFVDLELL
jgi:endonuclease/exonuclease/phosphatase family metal-dependent hydrolase